ncbi:MAG: iron transporter [Chloroflexi bacterium RBG_19FT_COMBO_55_16]|nr:MAG: iron transporter [Chloroflexi bacterium RBG_19FT_COMBO_55_16]
MPVTPHIERHFTATDTVRDIVIGMSDGLTVPFALAAGISGAGAASNIVVTAGLAEIAAGSIAMGLGGYLAARTDIEHYETERQREIDETEQVPEKERGEVAEIFREYGLTEAELKPLVTTLSKDRKRWVDFMMRFELGLDTPDPKRARQSALTIAISYIAGGLIPLSPYMLLSSLNTSLRVSVGVTLLALFLFGFFKGQFTGMNPLRSGAQTVLVGGLAAGVAFGLARLIG